ncbi:MAG: YlxM family DNA-binding protein [Erysipelotrichaceae bacterium]|nr:YlxM family DNA-binding protein [Erysipelotrichaceae bacterium]
MLDKIERMNALYDFYGDLLTDKQKEVFEWYYQNDNSLAEIAEQSGSSRAAVHDVLKRTEQLLEDYEKSLHLLDNFRKRSKIYTDLLSLEIRSVTELTTELIHIDMDNGGEEKCQK